MRGCSLTPKTFPGLFLRSSCSQAVTFFFFLELPLTKKCFEGRCFVLVSTLEYSTNPDMPVFVGPSREGLLLTRPSPMRSPALSPHPADQGIQVLIQPQFPARRGQVGRRGVGSASCWLLSETHFGEPECRQHPGHSELLAAVCGGRVPFSREASPSSESCCS